jgi:hypothetical protein
LAKCDPPAFPCCLLNFFANSTAWISVNQMLWRLKGLNTVDSWCIHRIHWESTENFLLKIPSWFLEAGQGTCFTSHSLQFKCLKIAPLHIYK